MAEADAAAPVEAASERLAFFKLIVPDADEAARFYADVLGMDCADRIDTPRFRERMMVTPGGSFTLVLMEWTDGRAITQGTAHGPVGFTVDDLDAVAARIEAAGGRIASGPFSLGAARILFMTTPHGHKIELIERGAAGDR